jgi:hypothetical protein
MPLILAHLPQLLELVEEMGVKVIPKRVVNDSAASRNSVVEMALSFSLSTGTSVKDFLNVSRKVPPGGYAFVLAMVCEDSIVERRRVAVQ